MKKIRYLLAFIIGLVVLIPNVYASSNYYEHSWTTNYRPYGQKLYGINDVIEINNGYFAIGGMELLVYTFDNDGNLLTTKLPSERFEHYFDIEKDSNYQ